MFNGKHLSDEDWENMKLTSDFLDPAASFIEMASSVGNDTISLQPALFKRLISNCNDWMGKDSAPNSVTVSAKLFKLKLKKYEKYLNSEFNNFALVLDPRSANKGSKVVEWKAKMRDMLLSDYDMTVTTKGFEKTDNATKISFVRYCCERKR